MLTDARKNDELRSREERAIDEAMEWRDLGRLMCEAHELGSLIEQDQLPSVIRRDLLEELDGLTSPNVPASLAALNRIRWAYGMWQLHNAVTRLPRKIQVDLLASLEYLASPNAAPFAAPR